MISIETIKYRTGQMVGEEFPLVMWRGTGRIVGSGDAGLSLLIRGVRVHFTWERLTVTWNRLLSNHTLDVDELGGGSDAVGIISIFAFMQKDGLDVAEHDGLLVLKEREETPVHQYANMSRLSVWAPWRRMLDA